MDDCPATFWKPCCRHVSIAVRPSAFRIVYRFYWSLTYPSSLGPQKELEGQRQPKEARLKISFSSQDRSGIWLAASALIGQWAFACDSWRGPCRGLYRTSNVFRMRLVQSVNIWLAPLPAHCTTTQRQSLFLANTCFSLLTASTVLFATARLEYNTCLVQLMYGVHDVWLNIPSFITWLQTMLLTCKFTWTILYRHSVLSSLFEIEYHLASKTRKICILVNNRNVFTLEDKT